MLTRAASDDPSRSSRFIKWIFGASRSSAELLEASHTERTCEVDSESVSKQTDEERGPSGILKLKLNTGRFKFNPPHTWEVQRPFLISGWKVGRFWNTRFQPEQTDASYRQTNNSEGRVIIARGRYICSLSQRNAFSIVCFLCFLRSSF